MACRKCGTPLNHSSGICSNCNLKLHGWPYDPQYQNSLVNREPCTHVQAEMFLGGDLCN